MVLLSARVKSKESQLVLYGEQIRAARSLLGWSQIELATRADVAHMTVRRFEASNGPVSGKIESLIRIQSALEAAGIIFQPADGQYGVGVRFAKPSEPRGPT
jgi:transcriptional regulator with XRE-family HTH domain